MIGMAVKTYGTSMLWNRKGVKRSWFCGPTITGCVIMLVGRGALTPFQQRKNMNKKSLFFKYHLYTQIYRSPRAINVINSSKYL